MVEIIGNIYVPISIGPVDKVEQFYTDHIKKLLTCQCPNIRYPVKDFQSFTGIYVVDAVRPVEIVKVFRNGKEVIR